MKKASISNKKDIQIQELSETNFVKFVEIESANISYKESISRIVFIQLYIEIDHCQLFSLKIFSKN